MKRDLVKLGNDLSDKVPFHPIVREFEIKGAKFRIRVGWGVNLGAMVEVYTGIGKDREWIYENWSMVPRGLLQSLTKSIKEEADALMQGMDAFIEKECEAEIRESITDVICKKGETKDRQEILVDAINSRILRMNDHFQTFPLPSTFNTFSIERTFEVPRPPAVPSDWGMTRLVIIDQDSFRLAREVRDTEDAMMVLMVMPQIAEFGLKVYTQLAQLAEWEKNQ
jgi:hypothetical protein